MADSQRLIELTIKLEAAQATGSLQDMKDASNELRDALLGAQKGTEGFTQAVTTLAAAKGDLKEFNLEARGITFDQQLQSTLKFANGFIGGFTAMKGAMSLFGNESSEQMKKMEQTMVSLIGVMQGLDKVARAFSEKNIIAIKALGQNFMTMLKSVQTASNGMKVALASTGIGLLVVGVGLLIANWDSLTAAMAKNAEQDKLEQQLANLKALDTVQKEIITLKEEEFDAEKKLADLNGDNTARDAAEINALIEKGKKLENNYKLSESSLDVNQQASIKAQQEYVAMVNKYAIAEKQAALDGKDLDETKATIASNIAAAKQKYDLTQSQNELDRETLDSMLAQSKLNTKLIDQKTRQKEIQTEIDTNSRNQSADENKIKLLEAEGFHQLAILQTEKDKNLLKINEIDNQKFINDGLTLENELKRNSYENDNKALDIKIALFKKNQDNAALIEKENAANALAQNNINDAIKKEDDAYKQIELSTAKVNKGAEEYNGLLIDTVKGYQDFVNLQNTSASIMSEDEKALISENNYHDLINNKIKVSNDSYQKILQIINQTKDIQGTQFKSIDDFNGKLKDNILLTTTELKSNEDIKDTTSLTAQQKINELSITKTLIQAQDEILKAHENNLNTQEKELQLIVKTLDDNGKLLTLEKAQNDNHIADLKNQLALATTDEQRLDIKNKIDAFEKTSYDINTKIVDNSDKIIANTTQQATITDEINQDEGKIADNAIKVNDATKKTTGELIQHQKLLSVINDFWKKEGTYIQASEKLLEAGLNAYSKAAANHVKVMQADYAQWQANTAAKQKETDAQITASQQKISDNQSAIDKLDSLESDANAARLGEIEKEKAALAAKSQTEQSNLDTLNTQKLAYANADIDRQNAIAAAQYESDKRQKEVDIVTAIANTAMSVAEDAWNPVLAIIAGATGAAEVATVASGTIPPPLIIPHQQSLGEGGMLEGNSHAQGGININAEGGEWIAPKWMVNNPQTAPMIDNLEAIRQSKPKFANGGTVPNGIPASPATQKIDIDYSRLAAAMQNTPINVSIKEIRDANRKFANVIYNKSSI